MDEAEFSKELEHLVSTAVEEGVRFDGGYPVRPARDDLPNYEVTITELSDTAD